MRLYLWLRWLNSNLVASFLVGTALCLRIHPDQQQKTWCNFNFAIQEPLAPSFRYLVLYCPPPFAALCKAHRLFGRYISNYCDCDCHVALSVIASLRSVPTDSKLWIVGVDTLRRLSEHLKHQNHFDTRKLEAELCLYTKGLARSSIHRPFPSCPAVGS